MSVLSSAPQLGRQRADAVTVLSWYLVFLFLIPSAYYVSGVGGLATPAVVFSLAMLLWWFVARILPDSGIAREIQPIRVAMFFFVGAILMSYVTFNRTTGPLDQSKAANSGLLLAFALLGVCLLAADGITSINRLRVLLHRVTLAVALVAVIGIIEYVSKEDIVTPVFHWVPGLATSKIVLFAGTRSSFSDIRRVSGTAVHPIEFGVVLAMALPLAAHFALTDRIRHGWRKWWKVAAIAIAEPMAQSRSGILALAIGAALLLPAWPKVIRRKMLAWSLPTIVVMRFAFPGLLGTITGLFLNFQSDPSYKSRTVDYGVVGTYIAQHPIFGRGFTTFLPKDFFFLDNQFLMSTIDIGFVGLAALIVLLVTGITLAWRARRWALTDEERLLAQALAASVAGGSLALATFDFFSFQMATGMLFLLFGCAGAVWRLLRAQARAAGHEESASPRKIVDLSNLYLVRWGRAPKRASTR